MNVRRKKPTKEQLRRRREVDERAARIQAAGVRPKDGVTFGKGTTTKKEAKK